jgi:hypothetical protein
MVQNRTNENQEVRERNQSLARIIFKTIPKTSRLAKSQQPKAGIQNIMGSKYCQGSGLKHKIPVCIPERGPRE